MAKKPYIDDLLLEWLDQQFPDRCPRISDSDRQVWMAAGARQVVDHLKALHNSQMKDALNVREH